MKKLLIFVSNPHQESNAIVCPRCDWEELGWIGDVFGNETTLGCGYDDDDCTEFNKKYPDYGVIKPWKIGNDVCDLDEHSMYNTKTGGYA